MLEEIVLDESGDFKSDLIVLGKRGLPHKLDNLRQIFFCLQNLLRLVSQLDKFRKVLFIVRF